MNLTDHALDYYRDNTKAVLRAWLRACCRIGSVPSGLSRLQLQPGRCTHRNAHTFEDAANFVLDISAAIDAALSPSLRDVLIRAEVGGQTLRALQAHYRCRTGLLTRAHNTALTALAVELARRRLIEPYTDPETLPLPPRKPAKSLRGRAWSL